LAVLAVRLHPVAGMIVAVGVAALLAYLCLWWAPR
jgi:uncharacterized membrane protein